ncbi:histidine utilization repressor [Thalassospira profundimaris]|uniref:histidine utilization repressor n=1 Tax=Thalassospira profundimaris TaxID=502049 RepID=UPI0015F061F0|nr:histidine utilization repressor [Thalassospira profundimaris]
MTKKARSLTQDLPAPLPATNLTLDGNGPLYAQIKRVLARQVISGHWIAGQQIPTEMELVTVFQASRMTVNRALRELVAEGVLTRTRGAGTYVADRKAQSPLLEIRAIERDIRARGHRHDCEIITFETIEADAGLATQFGLTPGEMLSHFICLHREDGQPVQIEDRWVNLAAAPAFARQDFRDITAAAWLLENAPYSDAQHLIEAVAADNITAKRLDIAYGAPCLVLHRRTWFHGTPITVAKFIHPGESYQLGGHFAPNQPSDG